VPADTKLGLTLDPARLMASSVHSWDTSQFAGWVPHQAISYLWPSGPFYWALERIGLPEWVVQRLWVGTVLFLGGAGIWWFVRRRGYSVGAAFVAGLLYQLSPYVLPYASRTSLMLLPWAGLGWLMGLAEQAALPGRAWLRPTALFGLVIATIGGINLTAIAMVAPAPILLLVEMARRGETSARRSALTALRIGVVSLLGSLWWMSMLSMQGRYGAKVLGYSETLEAVSTTSSAPEVLRGMGYWLSYVHAPSGTTTTAATPYMTSSALIAIGFGLLVLCLGALVVMRFAERALAGLLLVAGLVLSVGVHPITAASPLMSRIADASRSTLALSMRSSTRAVPMIVLATGLCAAALVDASARWRPRWRVLVGPLFVLLIVANQPALFTGDLVDPSLLHDQRPPREWYSAAAVLESGSSEYRVLQLPGVESQVFTWGYTVDPPLAWLTHKPLITRDWLPLGSAQAMDLLYAFDDRFQAGTAEPAAVAPLLRLLGADQVWLANDADSHRFASVSAADVAAVLDTAPGVAAGDVDNAHVTLYAVNAPAAIARATTRTVIVFGSGDGVVDAAGAGLLDGTEAILYAADLSDAELQQYATAGAVFLLTDSNRDRAHQWRGSHDVWGFTETGGAATDVLRFDPQDARLPVFAEERARDQTTAHPDGGVSVLATTYGSPVRYLPAYRAAMAIDGDPATAWMVGLDYGPTVGEQIRLDPVDGLRLVQATGGERITRIGLDTGGTHTSVDLGSESFTDAGQAIAASGSVTITIEAVSGPGPVGFAELLPSAHPETVRLPELRVAPANGPFGVVLTRLADQEPVLRRGFATPQIAAPEWSVSVRAAAAADLSAGCSDGLVTLDGAPVPLQFTAADIAALSAAEPTTLHACPGAVPISAGTHLLASSAGAGIEVSRVVIGAGLTEPTARALPAVTIRRSSDSNTVTVSDCPDGCWLVFGEGFSQGWSADSTDATLGRHLPISGGFNGWWVDPASGGTARITLHWAGQRPIWLALGASALTVLALLAAALWPATTTRRRARVAEPRFVGLGRRERLARMLIVGAAAVSVVAIAVRPHYGLLCIPIVGAAVVFGRSRLVALAGFAGVAFGTGWITIHQARHHFPADFRWPLEFERVHTLVFSAALLVGVVAAAGTDRPSRR
jgi:arabinofuranan 3-O-arabinosyltransferase